MKSILENLEAQGNLRQLIPLQTKQKFICYQNKTYLNLSSNDYLGLSASDLQQEFLSTVDWENHFLMSNPSSRLMTGNSPEYAALEETIGGLFNREALVLSSGYLTNMGVLPAVTEKDDLILADKLVHASLIDGLRLCECAWSRFRHNDMEHLKRLLQKNAGKYRQIFVVTESVFSMDGDVAPLRELVALKEQFGCALYVDEAHAFGVLGERGTGLAESLAVTDQIDYLVATMGKAVASQGAFVACDALKKEFLVNRMRSLIFSTAMPPLSLAWSRFVVERLAVMGERRAHLHRLSAYLREALGESVSQSNIVPVIVGDNKKTIALAQSLKEEGYWVTPIRTPTVPEGTARLRISLTAALTQQEVEQFVVRLRRMR